MSALPAPARPPFAVLFSTIAIAATVSAQGATATAYGTGCPGGPSSLYEVFTPTSPLDLGLSSIHARATGRGYVLTRRPTAFTMPMSPDLRLTDDSVTPPITLPFSFPLSDGTSTNAIVICSNGFVWLDGNQTSADWTESATELTQLAPRIAPLWDDLIPQPVGSIHYDVTPTGNAVLISWLAMTRIFSGGEHTFQLLLESNGDFELRYTIAGGPGLTGFSPGRGVPDPGPTDLSTIDIYITGRDQTPTALAADAPPTLGTTINLGTTGLPANTLVGSVLFSFNAFDPGIPLTAVGAPECFQYVGQGGPSVSFVPSSSAFSLPLIIPNDPNLAGLRVFVQTAAFAPGQTPSGLISTNGVALTVN